MADLFGVLSALLAMSFWQTHTWWGEVVAAVLGYLAVRLASV